jgi:hypothetical protein
VAGLIAPGVLQDARALQGAAASIFKIIESAKGFLEADNRESSGQPDGSAEN